MQKRKIAALLHRVTKRVAQVQRAAAAEVVLVRADDVALHLHADLDDVLVLLTHGRFVEFFKERCIAEHRILDDLGAAAAVLLLGQRFERVGIADHDAGLIEAARLILARGQVDGGLAADGRIDRGQQRRRDLGKAHAALIRRRGKAREVAHHAAAERNDHVAAAEAVLTEEVQHIGVGREVLAPLARGECERVHTVARLFKGLDRALAVERVDRVVRHDGGHAGGADLPEKLARAVE